MHPIKLCWTLRAFFYKLLFKRIGTMSYLGKPCFIEGHRRISIGNRTRIFPGIRMEAIGTGKITIGNNCAIEQNVHIISMNQNLELGDDVTVSANVFITNVDHDYKDITKSVINQEHIIKNTVINEGCFIGYGAIIQAGTVLGKHCVVGAGAVVRGTFPDYSVIVGVPGKMIKRYNNDTKEWEKVTK